MILGIDLSSSKIGISVINDDNRILFSSVLKLNSSISLEERCWQFRDYMKEVRKQFPLISKIYLERQFMNGGPNASTTAILLLFNGMCRYVIFDIFNKLPIYVDPRSARTKLGISIPRKLKDKQKKKVIIDFVQKIYENTDTPFEYSMTKQGNPVVGTDDIADSIVVALAGKLLNPSHEDV
jgi:Holliday junction resolvasome RuvABC endonuclease subunit